VQQERSMQEKIKEVTTSLEEQLSAIYGRLSKTTAQHQSTSQGIQSALQRLGETQSLLSQWTNMDPSPDSPSAQLATNSLEEPSSPGELSPADSLELFVARVHQGTLLLSAELKDFRALFASLFADNASFSKKLAALSRELPSEVRERCVREICLLESMDTVSPEEGEPGDCGLRSDLKQLILLQRLLGSCQGISSLFCEEMLRRESLLAKEHREELMDQISNLEARHEEQLLTLQSELSSRELATSSLAEEIQRRELATCRLLREKEEIERVLRGKLSSSEYQAIVGSRGPSAPREEMSTSSERAGVPTPVVPPFDLSSIYRAQRSTPLSDSAGGQSSKPLAMSLEEQEHEVATPHPLAKRNRGASVSVNTSRKQLFPDTPHVIPAGGKGRHKPSPAPVAAGIPNGRISALLGKSSPY
jgi:hypothetical protein